MLNETAVTLLKGPNIAHLATLMPDGSPQVTPVWVDTDGQDVLINTAEGRLKLKNMRRDPRVAVDLVDRDNPYRSVLVRGHVVAISEEGADAHIDQLAQRYLGVERYPKAEGERRVIVRIRPARVAVH